jgi:hypothetical protein
LIISILNRGYKMHFDWHESNNEIKDEKQNNDKKSLSARDKNELTADLIKKQIGDIEQVRALMGLNKRRMCELLLIDPSTWTRWTTGKTPPPTWVYRTLQWGLAVMDKHPEFHPLMAKQGVFDTQTSKPITNEKEVFKLIKEVQDIKRDLKKWTLLSFGLLALSSLLISYILIY